MAGFGHDAVMADGHYREAVREHLEPTGVYLRSAPEGADGKRGRTPSSAPCSAKGRSSFLPMSGCFASSERSRCGIRLAVETKVSISSPTWSDGAHGDLVAALVLAVWRDHGTEVQAARRTPVQEREDDILDSLLASGNDDWRR